MVWREPAQDTVAKPSKKIDYEKQRDIGPTQDARQHGADGKDKGGGQPQIQRPGRRPAGPGNDGQEQGSKPGEPAQLPPGGMPIKCAKWHAMSGPHVCAFCIGPSQQSIDCCSFGDNLRQPITNYPRDDSKPWLRAASILSTATSSEPGPGFQETPSCACLGTLRSG